MRLIICFNHTSRFYPARQGDFLWSDKHQCHVWQGLELTPEQFNEVAASVLQSDEHYIRPTVRVIEAEIPAATPVSPAATVAGHTNNFDLSACTLDEDLEKQLSELSRSITYNS